MRELVRRLLALPRLSTQLVVASVFINVLALASPLFVMQVLNRYVAHGVDSTLVTLTTGVLIAIALEFAFRQVRTKLARSVSAGPDEKSALAGFKVITRAKTAALEQIAPETRREIVAGINHVEQAYNANNITAVLDVPFSLFFVVVLWLLEPVLSLIVLAFIIFVFVAGVLGARSMKPNTQKVQELGGVGSGLLSTATREGDTIRSFNAGGFVREAWQKHTRAIQRLRRDLTDRQGLVQTISQSANGLMSVAIIGVGAMLVVAGKMDVGAMIGGNILASRALQPISKFSQLGGTFAKAREALELFRKLATVPLERERGSALTQYQGSIEFRDLAFTYGGSNTPIFESLNLKLDPGKVLVVTGANGAGKTTFARLLIGLLEPSRGQILVDGLDLQQIAPEWWRKQVVYLPQEPGLLNASIEENIRINSPDLDSSALNAIIDTVGLRRFLDESPDGLDTPVIDNGWRLSEGIRRRIALARALATDGMLVVVDEPTESLDADGIEAVHGILGSMAARGRTIIIMSHERGVVKGAHTLVDLNVKPVPAVSHADAANAEAAAESGKRRKASGGAAS
ncbi:MAG: ATP-binding cassette domain-containing protein [Rhodospirillales bacterium]